MIGLVLRRAEREDIDFMFEVRRAAFREYAEKWTGWDDAEQLARHRTRFDEQDYTIVLFDGAPVGYMATGRNAGFVDLYQIFLLPEHQSKGIGRACMLELMQRGLPVRLQVLKVNPRAQAFYDRLGFRKVGESDGHIQLIWDERKSSGGPS